MTAAIDPTVPTHRFGWLRDRGSGAMVARVFTRALAVVFLIAWGSLASQVHVLIGSRGLLPVDPWVATLRADAVPWFEWPTLLRFGASDARLSAGIVAGIGLACIALIGIAPRVCVALNTVLYLSYAVASRTFLSFQWDNLLLECGALAMFLPSDRRARLAHVAFRLLLFKLYFESGVAKWQSELHDWQDGSAMTFYFETAPLPTRLAWFAHHLPAWWHHFESRATLVLELIVPFGIFGPRRVRLAIAGVFTGFQIANAATANYGFFCWLAAALHVFLLDDTDVRRAWYAVLARVPARVRRVRIPRVHVRWPTIRDLPSALRIALAVGAWQLVAAWALASLYEALATFDRSEPMQARLDALDPIYRHYEAFRLVNTYHLFASITRERIEPEIQLHADENWIALDLHHEPGSEARAPDFVAPHQPRVDFQLWFYGLSFQRGMPTYVRTLLERVCLDPDAVQSLFADPIPTERDAVRIAFWRYHFSTAAERASTGAWWTRELLGTTRTWRCRAGSVP